MSTEERLIYASSNGDRWVLVDGANDVPRVRHKPNKSSGGSVSEISVHEFLQRDEMGPEHEALRSMLAAAKGLVTQTGEARHISAAQIRAGRGLLGWSVEQLAHEAQVGVDALIACESGRVASPQSQLVQISRALGLGGVVLIGEGEIATGGPGVRMGTLGTSTGQPVEYGESDANDNSQPPGEERSASLR